MAAWQVLERIAVLAAERLDFRRNPFAKVWCCYHKGATGSHENYLTMTAELPSYTVEQVMFHIKLEFYS